MIEGPVEMALEKPCFGFEVIANWNKYIHDYAPQESVTLFCKAKPVASVMGTPVKPNSFQIVPFVNYSIHRKPSPVTQIWSVHIAVPDSSA